MIAEMSEALAAVGVGQDRVFEEYFCNARFRPRWEDVEAIASRFTASDARNLFADLPPRRGFAPRDRPLSTAARLVLSCVITTA